MKGHTISGPLWGPFLGDRPGFQKHGTFAKSAARDGRQAYMRLSYNLLRRGHPSHQILPTEYGGINHVVHIPMPLGSARLGPPPGSPRNLGESGRSSGENRLARGGNMCGMPRRA